MGVGYSHSEEERFRISERMRDNKHGLGMEHSEEERKRISQRMLGNKNGLGSSHTDEEKERIKTRQKGNKNGCKLILNIETGIFYNGIREAADSLNTKEETLRYRLRKGTINNTPFIYV